MPRKQSWFNVKAAEGDAKAGEVSIRGYIGEWGVTDRDFIASVDALGDVEELHVRINSRGGEMDHALSMFNYLKTHKARIKVRVDGVAMSSGSIIAMAGDEIVMPANAIMMVHNPWTIAMGNAKQLRQEAENLDTWEAALVATYTARTGQSEDEIRALLDEDTYMTAAEAVQHGFADRVEAIGKRESASAAVAYAAALGIPAEVLARVEAAERAAEDELAGDPADPAEGGHDAPPDETAAALAAAVPASLVAGIQAAAEQLGLSDYAADIALDPAIQDAPSAIAALKDAREIVDLCALAKHPDMARALVRRRAGVAEARQALVAARAGEDEALHTDSALPSGAATQSRKTPAAVSTAGIWSARQARH